MAIHEDGTMDVRVNGKIERRKFSVNRDAGFSNSYMARMRTRYEPELRDGEECFFTLADDTPDIVNTGRGQTQSDIDPFSEMEF